MGFPSLGLLLVGYLLAEPLGIPVCVIAILSGLLMLMLAGRWFHPGAIAIVPIGKVLRETPCQIILFLQGMSLLVNSCITFILTIPILFISLLSLAILLP